MDARQLAVAHQNPGECAYCDSRYQEIYDAVARELAAAIRYQARTTLLAYEQDAAGWAADLIDPDKEQ